MTQNISIYSTLIAAVGAFGFALTAQGFWSAAFCWGLVGAGLAGTYMPGLQILNARLDDDHRLRLLPYYICIWYRYRPLLFCHGLAVQPC